jgi:hypothetical protein
VIKPHHTLVAVGFTGSFLFCFDLFICCFGLFCVFYFWDSGYCCGFAAAALFHTPNIAIGNGCY